MEGPDESTKLWRHPEGKFLLQRMLKQKKKLYYYALQSFVQKLSSLLLRPLSHSFHPIHLYTKVEDSSVWKRRKGSERKHDRER